MVNKKFLLGILVLVLVFGMTVVGCEGEEVPNNPPTPTPNIILSVSISTGSDDDTPKVDSSLSAEVRTSKESTYGVSYQWKRGTSSYSSFENISGATSSSYRPVIEDIGKYIKVDVKNSDTPNPKESSAVGPVVDARPGKTPSYPIDRVVSDTNLGVMTSSASGWRQLLTSIENTGNYINLDLSACTMSGTSFNPDSTVETGKKYIVSIILPTVATSIEAETSGLLINSTFKNFNNLISVSGDNIITIGKYSFHYNSKLKSVNFPKVTTIGELAFYSCGLENADFPLVQAIGVDAFSSCSSMESMSFPASAELGLSSGSYSNPFINCSKLTFNLIGTGSLSVIENGKALIRNNTILVAYPSASGNITMNSITALGVKVFYGCSGLTDISFPQVTTIGSYAFYGCFNIQDVTFPQATNIGSYAFSSSSYSTSRLQSGDFPLVTTIEQYAFSNCPLSILNIPNVTNIKSDAFSYPGNDALTITMGNSAPNLDYGVFGAGTSFSKTVKVKIPTGATGYSPAASPFAGTSVTVSGTSSNWGNGFRGMGWNGTTTTANTNALNQNISLTIEKTQ
jgi:hypothetical protein